MTLPSKCKTCVHNDHGHCFAESWCVYHPAVMEAHSPMNMYRAIETTEDLMLDYSDGTEGADPDLQQGDE